MQPAIEVSHLTKEYQLGPLGSLRQTATNFRRKLLGRQAPPRERFLALDDVSFTVQPGEVVGVIGHNGAGKSTLLKILSRIVTPTSGSAIVNGRVAPLIEVGAGFVGDMTGRENVYLNGAILGLKKREIDRKFDEIVAFAEMEQFIDTPVKRYSSGMQVKLAFAVATSIDSEILIVDEVLAVGDLGFQRKCFDKMEELIRGQGRTVLLVTHNIRQVERLCDRALMLLGGKIAMEGHSRTVCEHFYSWSQDNILNRSQAPSTQSKRINASNAIHTVSVLLKNHAGNDINTFSMGADLRITLEIETTRTLKNPIFAVGIHTPDLLYLAVDRSSSLGAAAELEPGKYEIHCDLMHPPLLPGVYAIRASIVSGEIPAEDFYGENLAAFHVTSHRNFPIGDMRGEGFISLNTAWSLSRSAIGRQHDITQA